MLGFMYKKQLYAVHILPFVDGTKVGVHHRRAPALGLQMAGLCLRMGKKI